MKKRILCVLLSMLMLLSVTACGKNNADTFYGDSEAKTDVNVATDTTNTKTDISKDYSLDIPKYDKYFELGEYKNITYYIDDSDYEVNSDTVNRMILTNLNVEPKEATDRPAKKGDYVNVTFKGTIDGKEFDGSSASNINIVIGEYKLMKEFEDALIGLNAGEENKISYTFPKDYRDESVAGKTAIFDVTLNSIKDYSTNLITDDMVKENTDYKTLDEYRNAVIAEIKDELAQQKKIDAASIIMSKILENSKIIGYDEDQVNEMIEAAKFTTEMYAKENNTTAEDYVIEEYGYDSYEDYENGLGDSAKEYLNTIMTISAIAYKEGLTVTDKEYQNQIKEYTEEYNITTEELSKYYVSNDIIYSILITKVYDWLLDNSVKLDNPETT